MNRRPDTFARREPATKTVISNRPSPLSTACSLQGVPLQPPDVTVIGRSCPPHNANAEPDQASAVRTAATAIRNTRRVSRAGLQASTRGPLRRAFASLGGRAARPREAERGGISPGDVRGEHEDEDDEPAVQAVRPAVRRVRDVAD